MRNRKLTKPEKTTVRHSNASAAVETVVGLCLLVALLVVGGAAAQEPFPCAGEPKVVQAAPDPNNPGGVLVTSAQLFFINEQEGVVVPIGDPQPFPYNNMGQNRTNGLLYAVKLEPIANPTVNFGIIRIDSNGVVYGPDPVAGLPANVIAVSGDVSYDGTKMYLHDGFTGSGHKIYTVDLGSMSVVEEHVVLGGTGGEVYDWAFNPFEGKLYGGSTGGRLAQLDPTTGNRVDFAVAGIPIFGGCCYGGSWFNAAGEFFLYHNSGRIFGIDLGLDPDPNPVAVSSDPARVSARNDAAVCLQDLVGAAKLMTPETILGPGPITILYTFENVSDQFTDPRELFDLWANDNLEDVFGVHGVDWLFTAISGDVANPGFDGHTDLNLISPGQSLLPGEWVTVTVEIELLTLDHLVDGQFCNQVTVMAVSEFGQAFTDVSTEGVHPFDPAGREPSCIDAGPALSHTKTLQGNADEDGSGTVSQGDTLTYEFVATNSGAVPLTNVTIVDPLAGLSSLDCAPPQPAQ